MTRNRRPLRLALEELTDAVARAVLNAVRNATIGDLLDFAAPTTHDGAQAPSLAREVAPVRKPIARGRPVPTRSRRVAHSAEPAVEAPVREGTEIDALAMLTSLDAQPAVQRAPELDPTPVPAVPPPAEVARPAPPERALRQGESVLRSGTGTVVIRRRRAS